MLGGGFARLAGVRLRYPFDALHWLRHQRVDDQATVLSESIASTARARAEEARAEEARKAAEQAMCELECGERERLDEGQLRAGDLQAVGDWRKGAEAALEAKAERERRAREARLAEVAKEAEARRTLGDVSNEAKVIDTHRESFRSEAAAARERAEEEAANEQWTASRFPPRRS